MLEQRSIVTHTHTHPSLRTALMIGLATLLLLGMVAAFGLAPNSVTYSGKLIEVEVLEELAKPIAQTITSDIEEHMREIRIRQGDTVYSLLAKMGINSKESIDFLRSSRDAAVLFRQLVPGRTITAKVTSTGDLQSLIFPLNSGSNTVLQVQRTRHGLEAQVENITLESNVSLQSAVIRHSLFGAADEAGIPDGIAIQLTDIFGGDIDFHRDLRKGDSFSVIYEISSHLGKTTRTERILAAEFINNNKTYHAFWHTDLSGSGSYYTADGRSVKKAFLRSPLEFSRITSGFSSARYHPVIQEMRAHRGIDYGAPTGTRVKATGDGTVQFVGTQGGYGKVVMLRHTGDILTVYGHLSGYPSGIKAGKRVSQGETIGFVGATGVATGPHLHYEFKVAGIHRNPLTATRPNTPPLPSDQMTAFKDRIEELMFRITTIRDTKLVMLD